MNGHVIATVAAVLGLTLPAALAETQEERVRERPDDARAHFRLGVARRRRHDSDSPAPNDFQKAVEHW